MLKVSPNDPTKPIDHSNLHRLDYLRLALPPFQYSQEFDAEIARLLVLGKNSQNNDYPFTVNYQLSEIHSRISFLTKAESLSFVNKFHDHEPFLLTTTTSGFLHFLPYLRLRRKSDQYCSLPKVNLELPSG